MQKRTYAVHCIIIVVKRKNENLKDSAVIHIASNDKNAKSRKGSQDVSKDGEVHFRICPGSPW